jgi:hypothetical protein
MRENTLIWEIFGVISDWRWQTTKEVKVTGAIGHLISVQKKSPNVSTETVPMTSPMKLCAADAEFQEVGVGGTSAWRICGLDPNTTIAVYFEIVNQVPLSTSCILLRVSRMSWTAPTASMQYACSRFETLYRCICMFRSVLGI